MSVYYVIYAGSSDAYLTSPGAASYSTAREGGGTITRDATGTIHFAGQQFSTPNYSVFQTTLEYDTSAVTGSIQSATYYIWTSGTPAGGLIEIREYTWSGATSDFRAGSTLGNYSLVASLNSSAMIANFYNGFVATSLPTASASYKVLMSAANQRNNVTPTALEYVAFNATEQTGTTNDPYLSITTNSTGWTYVGKSSTVTAASGNVVLTEPAGVQSGDLLVASIAYRSNATFTLPSGWALVATQQSLGNTSTNSAAIGSGLMAYIVRGGSAPALTFTRTAGDVALGAITAYRGNHATPYDTGTSNTIGANSATVTTGTFTTAEDDELIVVAYCGGQEGTASAFVASSASPTAIASSDVSADSTLNPMPNQFLERLETTTITGADTALSVADCVKTTAGATGTIQMTSSISAARHVMVAGAFKMAAAVAPTPSLIFNPQPLQHILVR